MSFYKEIIKAKDENPIPLFFNNKPMFSKYNPLKDVEIFTNQFLNLQEKKCLLIGGVGTGLHIKKLEAEKNISIIFALENDKESIEFSKKHFQNIDKIIFCTLENLENTILENYIPQIHGDFAYKSLNSWILALKEYDATFDEKIIQEKVLSTLKNISRDVATQSFFGKIWHKNIFHNIKNFYEAYNSELLADNSLFHTDKTLAIIGASPNLDNTISELKENPEKYFIIATDTSFQILLQHKIIPQVVATLDGQVISSRHFLQKIPNSTILLADFCANPNIIEKFLKNKSKIAFTNTGHPLVSLFDLWLFQKNNKKSIYRVSAGNGTVLQLALDFGFSIGFTKYQLFGAEFAYTQNKPYAQGTYFDYQYNFSATKLNSTEKSFSSLMYKTQIIKNQDKITTENLKAYKDYLENYLENKKYSYNKDVFFPPKFEYKDFFHWYINALENDEKNVKKSLFPLLAWINNYKKNSDNYNEALFFTKKLLLCLLNEE